MTTTAETLANLFVHYPASATYQAKNQCRSALKANHEGRIYMHCHFYDDSYLSIPLEDPEQPVYHGMVESIKQEEKPLEGAENDSNQDQEPNPS